MALAQLEQGRHILSSQRRDLPERQRTMHAAIRWRVQLLPEDSQQAFLWLGAFTAGFDLDIVEELNAVQGSPMSAVDTISELINLCLVRRVTGGANLDKMIAQEKHARANLQPTGLEEINLAVDESGITGMPESLAAGRYLVNVTRPEPGEMGPSGAIVSDGVLLAGESMIEVCNVGEQIHHLSFVRVPNGTPHESVQALWNSYLSGTPEFIALSETDTTEIAYFAEISPTVSEWGPIPLKPGTYVLSCFVGDPAMGGMPHAFMGVWERTGGNRVSRVAVRQVHLQWVNDMNDG